MEQTVPRSAAAADVSRAKNDAFDMTLQRIKLFAILTPIAVVITLEIARTFLTGTSLRERWSLDTLIIIMLIIFPLLVFRLIGRIQDRLERQNRELLALHSAGLDVAAELSLDLVLKKVVDQARLLVGARYGALSVIDADGRIQSFVTSGISNEQRAAIGPPPVGRGVLGVVLREGHRLRLDDLSKHPKSVGFPANHPAMTSLLAVPVSSKGPFRGNLYLADKTLGRGSFTEDDERTLERFGVQAAIAIDNAYLHEKAADLAIAQERVRIAHEMHDGLAQVLGYVNTKVQAAEGFLARGRTADASQQLHELAVSAREAYTDVRESIVGLRALPGSDRTLKSALEEFVSRWEEQSGVEVTVSIEDGLHFRTSTELQLIRIVQESLTNVRKHAKASHALVDIRRGASSVKVRITDDGNGFEASTLARSDFPRLGLTTMHERAASIGGTLVIESAPGKGTSVSLELPLGEAEA